MASAAGDVQEKTAGRRPAAGIPIDGVYLEHLRNTRRPSLSRAKLAELVGLELFDRELFDKVLDGAEPPGARTLRVLAGLGVTPDGSGGWRMNGGPLTGALATRGWTRDDLADKTARRLRARDTVAKWENGERNPKSDALAALCTVLSTPEHEVMPSELMTGESPRNAAREAAAAAARESYYTGLRHFAEHEGVPWTDEDGVPCFSAELRRAYDRHLLNGGSQLAPF